MGVRIQELPETTGINKEDVLIVEDGQGTKKGTVQQLDETLGVSQLKEDLINLGKEINILDNVNLREDLYWDYTSGYGNVDAGTNYVFWNVTERKTYKAIGRCGGNSANHCFIGARKKEGTFEVIAPTGDYRYGFEFEIDSSLYDIIYVTYVAEYGIELTEIATNPYEEKFLAFKDITGELNWTKDYAYNYSSKSFVSDTGSIVCSLDVNGGRRFKISGGTGGNSSLFATVVCIDKDGNICGTLKNGVYYTEEEYTLPIGTVIAWFTFSYNNALMYKIMIEDTVKVSDAIEKSQWYGKSWISYGDSITQQQKWQGYVNKELGFSTFRNCGIGGTCISDTGENGFVLDSRLSSLNKTSDLIFVMGGTNDFGQSVPLGDLSYPFVETTFKGAIASLIVKLQNLMPNTKIVFGTQVSGDGGNVSGSNITEVPKNSLGLTPEDYAKAMIEVCDYMSIPVIDVYHNCGINPFNRATYISDTVHPNDRGGMMIAKVVSKGLNNIYPQDVIN